MSSNALTKVADTHEVQIGMRLDVQTVNAQCIAKLAVLCMPRLEEHLQVVSLPRLDVQQLHLCHVMSNCAQLQNCFAEQWLGKKAL